MNNESICNYAYIRFVPNPETEEFANVGIVLINQRPLSFQFKVEKHWSNRLRVFFTDTDPESYVSSCESLETELKRLAAMVIRAKQGREPELPDFNEQKLIRLFQNLTTPREGTLQFSEPRTLVTDEPDLALNELFSEIVTHSSPHTPSTDLSAMAV